MELHLAVGRRRREAVHLKLTNPRTPAGVTLELVFKRAK
jgi:hypothetical protein